MALDISEPLLAHAKSRKNDIGVATEYRLVDAQIDPIGDNEFDLAISRFGTMFFEDPAVAFQNIRKALRPGGRLVVVGWAAIDGNPWFELPQDCAIARLGPPDKSDPNCPGPLGFQNTDYVTEILTNAGYANVSAEHVLITLRHPGPVEDVVALATNIGPAARILKKYNANAEDIEAIKAYVSNEFREFDTEKGVQVPAWLNFFRAMNPTADT